MGRLFCGYAGGRFSGGLPICQWAGLHKYRLFHRCTGSPGASPACDSDTGRDCRARCSGCNSGCGNSAGPH